MPGAQVVALADHDRERAARVARRFAIPQWFGDVDALLDARVADAIGVLVPPADHAKVALAALGAGCHVLVEKPIALSLAVRVDRAPRTLADDSVTV